MASKVLELRAWAEEEAEDKGSGERDNAPRHTDREWRQVSVGHRDCLGAAKCPFGQECFVELAREKAHRSHLVITNHSLLAIDAIEGVPMIPDYDVAVIDEAHELVARVTQAATDELCAVRRRARRAPLPAPRRGLARPTTWPTPPTRCATRWPRRGPAASSRSPTDLADALVLVRDAARACLSAYPKADAVGRGDGDGDAGLTQAKGTVQDVFVTAERMAAGSDADVLWLAEGGDRIPPRLCVAPLQVWGPMRDKLLTDKTVVMTSATLMLGGDFAAVADQPRASSRPSASRRRRRPSAPRRSCPGPASTSARPFDYGQQAILYVARHLPPPGRDGLVKAQLDEIVELVDAAEGRTLGLFSTRRAAETAAEAVRTRLPAPHHAGPGRGPAARAGAPVRRATPTPACSARSACGRASTSPATPASSCSSTGSRSRAPTTR